MPAKNKLPASTNQANELLLNVFSAAKSRQVFGVDWRQMSNDDRIRYVTEFLNREVYYHQIEPILTLTNPKEKFITYNASRQVGKCCDGQTYVTLATGEVQELCKLEQHTPIRVATVYQGKITTALAIVFPTGVKDTFENIYFSSESLTTSADHRFFRRKTKRPWKDGPVTYLGYDYVRCEDQHPRDHIATVRSLASLVPKVDYPISDSEIAFLAYQLADGHSSKSRRSLKRGGPIGFTNKSKVIVAELATFLSTLNTKVALQKGKDFEYSYSCLDVSKESQLRPCLIRHGIFQKDCYEKAIPECVFQFSSRQLALFINRFFACDGYASTDKLTGQGEIGCTLANRLMISQLANILRMLGFAVRVKKSSRPCCLPDGTKKYFEHWSVCVSKSLEQYERFEKEVNIYTKEQQVHRCVEEVRKLKSSYRFVHSLEDDLRFAYFQRRKPVGQRSCYDLSIIEPPKEAGSDYEPNFIANGFVVHNSESMSWAEIICGVHNTHPALDNVTKAIGIANKLSQTQIVASRVRALLNENYQKTQHFWDRDGSTKFHVSFKRESGVNSKETGTIDYITSNPKAFSEGFTGSILFIDEANRIDPTVFSQVLLPFLGSTGGTLVLTGVSRGRGAFYDACNNPDYKHLHYPWDKVETYRRSSPADLVFGEDADNPTKVLEVGLYPLQVMPINLKKVVFPENPYVHILPTPRQDERWVRLWDLSVGSMSEDDFRSQYMLEWLADVLALLQLYDQQLLFQQGQYEPLSEGKAGEPYWFGLDCGGSRNAYATTVTDKDRASLSVWTVRNNVKCKVWCDEKDDVLPEQLVAWLREMCHPADGRFRCSHGTVDVTGAVGAFASQHLKNCGIPIIPIIYNRTEEITKKNFKNAMFDFFKLENSAGRTQYPNEAVIEELNETTMLPKYPTFVEHREQWEKIERKLTTSVNSIISAPAGEHDDGPNSDVLCVYGMSHPQLFEEDLKATKRRVKQGLLSKGMMGGRRTPFGFRR